MATPIILPAYRVRVWRGIPTGAAPDNYVMCGLVTSGLQQTKQTNTAIIPDCDFPELASSVKRTVISKDVTMSGEGYYEPDLRTEIQEAFDSQVSEVWSFEFAEDTVPTAESIGYYTGLWHFTTFGLAAAQGEYVRSEMAWEADGPIEWVPVVAVGLRTRDRELIEQVA